MNGGFSGSGETLQIRKCDECSNELNPNRSLMNIDNKTICPECAKKRGYKI